MTDSVDITGKMPVAAERLMLFARQLRSREFLITSDQITSFLSAVHALGPRSINDIRSAARVVFGPPPERMDEFDALFQSFFLGRVLAAPTDAPPDDEEMDVVEDRDGDLEPPDIEDIDEGGTQATEAEARHARLLSGSEDSRLSYFARRAPAALPRVTARRMRTTRHGRRLDLRRTLQGAASFDGELIDLRFRQRKRKQRPILLLIDVSGSMKDWTDRYFRFAHTLARVGQQVEVFTLGTHLTRVTRTLRLKNRDRALARTASLVSDWDGGTRLGDALATFLSVPRFAGFARGALVVTLSDGLERQDAANLQTAAEKMARLCWKHVWLTPLGDRKRFQPETQALVSIAHHIDLLGGGASIDLLCRQILELENAA